MSLTPAISVFKPLRFQEGLRKAKQRLTEANLLDADSDTVVHFELNELIRMLEPPLDRIVVNRKLRRFLPVLATHPQVPHASREKALELALKRVRSLPVNTVLSLYEEYYDRPLLKQYFKTRYPAEQSFGIFSMADLLDEAPAQRLLVFLFQELKLGLDTLYSETKFRAEGRLAREILYLLLESPPVDWLGQISSRDLEAVFFICKTSKARFNCLQKWLLALFGGDYPSTRSEIVASKAARGLIDWFTADERLGNPFDAVLRWREAEPELRQLVQLYFFEKVIDDFFSKDSDGDRFEFWRGYSDHCSELRRFDRQGAFAMKIGELWFVEFVPTGACYIYSESSYQEVVARPHADLKRRELCVSGQIWVQGATGPAVLSPPLSHVDRGSGRSYPWQRQFDEYIRKYALK